MVHGKVESEVENKDLSEILGAKKYSKFSDYKDKAVYESALFGMSHRELCEEAIRVGTYPSAVKEVCRNKCLEAWDKAKKNYKHTTTTSGKKSLDDIIKGK